MLKYIHYDNGFFIEAGSNDGVQQSNTLYLEKYLRWKGLLIEPVPELARQCSRNRPKCVSINCALVPLEFKEKNILMTSVGLMSFVNGAFASRKEESAHLFQGAVHRQPQPQKISVPARTLESVCKEHNLRYVDFLSLDVEGFEDSVLRGINLREIFIRYILVEARYPEKVRQVLRPCYEFVEKLSPKDLLFRRK